LGTQFHPWVQNFTLEYKSSPLGTKFHPWVQKFTPRYKNLVCEGFPCEQGEWTVRQLNGIFSYFRNGRNGWR
jgi:hypothetical protein